MVLFIQIWILLYANAFMFDRFIMHASVMITSWLFYYSQNDKILDSTNLHAFADDKLDSLKIMIAVFDRAENINSLPYSHGF